MTQNASPQMVTMGYALFLGRYPENESVIQEKSGSDLNNLVVELICSEEFENCVVPGIFNQRHPLPHEQFAPQPTAEIVNFARDFGCLNSERAFVTWPDFLLQVLTAVCKDVLLRIGRPDSASSTILVPRVQGLLFSLVRHMATMSIPAAQVEDFNSRLERVSAQAREAEASGRELGALRNALNEAVWRTERSYLDLSGTLNLHSQRLRTAQEQADDLHSRLDSFSRTLPDTLNRHLDERIAGFDQKLLQTAEQSVVGKRELDALRNALNDTVWRAERSYLGLAEGLAAQDLQIRTALERTGHLADHLSGQMNERIAGFDQKLLQTAEQSAAGKRELDALRNALNDTVWRAERSYLGLAEGLAARDLQIRTALEHAGRLDERVGAAEAAQAEESAALEQRLLQRMKDLESSQSAEIQALRKDVEAAVAARQTAEERAAALTAEIDRLRGEIASVSMATRQSAEERTQAIGDALEALNARVDSVTGELGSRLESIDAACGSLRGEIDGIATQARQSAEEKTQAIGDALEALNVRVDSVTGDLGSRLERIDAACGALRGDIDGIAAETRRSVGDMANTLGQTEKVQEIGTAIEALSVRMDGLKDDLDARLQGVDAAGGDIRSIVEDTRSAASEARERATAVSRALDSVFRIISQEIRPLGLLFPFNAEADLATAEQYKEKLGALKTEPVSSCAVCHSNRWTSYGFVDGFSLSRCADCGHIFPNPRIAESELDVLYSDHYWDEHQKLNGLASLRERLLFDYHNALPRLFMLKSFRPTGRLLDIGCAAGALVRRAQEFGYKSVGMEVNSQIAALGQEYFNIKITTGRIENTRLSRRSFDIITMFDVFEHLYNPDAVLKKLHETLDRNGILVIETFRTDCPDFERDPLRHPDCKPMEHVGMYSENGINRIIERNNFNIIETRYPQGTNGSRVIKIAAKN